MNNLLVLVKKELLEQQRTKKILIIAVLLLFVAVASPITAKLLPLILKSVQVPGLTINLPEPSYMDSLDQFIKNISQLVVFILVFVVAGAISEEKTTKTIEIVLTKPISRASFVLSKFIAYFASISLLFLTCAVVFYLYTLTTFGTFSAVNFALLSGTVLVYILMIISVTLFASSFSRSTIAAAGLGLFFMIIVLPIVGLFKSVRDYSPSILVNSYKDIVQNGFSSLLVKPLIITFVVIVISTIFAVIFFNKQEIER